jgi:hypothetical protein
MATAAPANPSCDHQLARVLRATGAARLLDPSGRRRPGRPPATAPERIPVALLADPAPGSPEDDSVHAAVG